MTDLYKKKTRRKHPILKPIQYKNVYESLSTFVMNGGLIMRAYWNDV